MDDIDALLTRALDEMDALALYLRKKTGEIDEGEEMDNQAEQQEEEEENTVSPVSETEELCSLETEKVMEGRCETAGYGGRDGAWRFLKLLAIGGAIVAVAAIGVGVVVRRFLGDRGSDQGSDEESDKGSDKGMVNLVPT